jgi:hypothetical protein
MTGNIMKIRKVVQSFMIGAFFAFLTSIYIPVALASGASTGMSVGLTILPVINYTVSDNKLNFSSNDQGQSVVIYDGKVIYAGNNGPGVQTIELPENKPDTSHEITILSGI